ncbi:MAG: lipocalin-like domain-containing protein [Saprospiraceae bacterium]
MKNVRLVILLIVLTLTFNSFGQNKSKTKKASNKEPQSNKLVGNWRIVEYSDFDTLTGKWKDRYGQHPRGYFTYTQSGIVNINISTDNPMRISEDSAKKMSVNYFQIYKYNAFGYFGTYTVDWEKSIVTHHVKGGSLLWYIDTDQPRQFVLKGDTLIIGDNKTTKRMLVRVD